ncbi:uncharacterized protein K444DRAFT_641303 [Hyaloscypha bicolor E]|uniref:Uncharacterized protein n=1 Tax=Hyaloscypha bicolor E TaxID=1095630 RepID=A0A2J6TKF3_9HELO|nr:uncharacterized protein K444DRAFT_641303 [Hyaloscypha bicolor E]PMD63468.1 hypothetical protein K444DRAFT_641303 [Hyaloscypha bicolor E]
MEPSYELGSPQKTINSSQPQTLEVDFSWKKFKLFVTSKNSDSTPSKPLYIIEFKTMKSQLLFKSAVDDSILGTGTLHPISIDAECLVRGQDIKLKAQKRFKIEYEYFSTLFSDTENGEPVPMTWVCDTGMKTCGFVCLDRNRMPVARFQVNLWAAKNVGVIELLGVAAEREEVRDEVVVTGLTLFYFTVLRSSSIFSFFGAVFSRPGKEKAGKESKERVE